MIDIFGISLHDRTSREAVDMIVRECCAPRAPDRLCVSATGAHGLTEARMDPRFGAVLKGFWLNLPDGVPVVWVGRLKGAKQMQRCYGPDFFRDVMIATAQLPVKHFFCGGREGIAEELRGAVESKFQNSHCVGTYCPPFRALKEREWTELTKSIEDAHPDIVWIGLGTPKQEIFALELARRARVKFIITVGAAFDMHTGHLRQAPSAVQRLGLEWLFRLLMEPRRLWRRYVKVVPLFLLYAALDLAGQNRRRS